MSIDHSWGYDKPRRPRKPTYASKTYSSKPSSRWEDLPWEDLHESVEADQKDAVKMAEDQNMVRYKAFLEAKEAEWVEMHPEYGSCEQSFTEEYPYRSPPASYLFKVKQQAAQAACIAFCEQYSLKSFGVNYLEQITGFLARYTLETVSGLPYNGDAAKIALAEGRTDMLISSRALYKKVFDTPKMKGVYHFLMMDNRSSFLEKQYTTPGRDYCALVPLIPMAFKRHHMVPYSHWETSDLKGLVSKKLYEAMTFDEELPTKTDILNAREVGLTIQTGADSGKSRNPVYTHKLYGAQGLKELPELLQVMLAQIWCAHPSNRTKYMILSCENWDSVPPSLLPTDVLVTDNFPDFSKPTVEANSSHDLW
jgi:hypothetical protein